MIRGSCLCGNVGYEIDGTVDAMMHCHCTQCRKANGGAFGTYVKVAYGRFRFVLGRNDVASYASSAGVRRTFCKACGSSLQFIRQSRPEGFWLAAGTLDDDPGVRPTHHLFVGSKAPWCEIADRLPQFHARKPLAG